MHISNDRFDKYRYYLDILDIGRQYKIFISITIPNVGRQLTVLIPKVFLKLIKKI